MNECARQVVMEFRDIRIAFGESDEYSFVLHKDTQLWGRRSFKLIAVITSLFAAQYVFQWSKFMGDTQVRRWIPQSTQFLRTRPCFFPLPVVHVRPEEPPSLPDVHSPLPIKSALRIAA